LIFIDTTPTHEVRQKQIKGISNMETISQLKATMAARRKVPVLSGKANQSTTQSSNPTVYNVTTHKYFLTRVNGETYIKSQLNLASCNVPFLLVKAGPQTPVRKKTATGQTIEYAQNNLTEAEFQSIVTNRPSYKQITAAYVLHPIADGPKRFAVQNALDREPTILW